MANLLSLDKYNLSAEPSEGGLTSDFCIGFVTVFVNGSDNNPAFTIDYESEWFDVVQHRNNIEIRVKPNADPLNRYGYVTFTHVFDKESIVTLYVMQPGTEYEVKVNDSEEYMVSDLNCVIGGEIPFEDICLELNTKGGSRDVYIKDIVQYTGKTFTREIEVDGNIVEEAVKGTTPYDKGLILFVLNRSTEVERYNNNNNKHLDTDKQFLIVRNHGRTFVDETNYYEVTLAHIDHIESECKVVLKYKPNVYNMTLSTDSIEIDYLGRTDELVEISFGESCMDYGYCCTVSENDWLTVIENPTSLSFKATKNDSGVDRTATITICSTEKENMSETVSVTQRQKEVAIAALFTAMREADIDEEEVEEIDITMDFVVNGDTILAICPENVILDVMVSTTGRWCSYSKEVEGNVFKIKVHCKENLWTTRKCLMTIRNAYDSDNQKTFIIKQENGINFSIS